MYRVGANYEGAMQREQFMMQMMADKRFNVGKMLLNFILMA